jgi:hypothetical protein
MKVFAVLVLQSITVGLTVFTLMFFGAAVYDHQVLAAIMWLICFIFAQCAIRKWST